MKISQAVINVAKHHEEAETLYMSKDGSECTLQVDKKHPVAMSREEVLKAECKEVKAKKEDAPPPPPPTDETKPELAKDLIAKIEVAETIEAVDAIVGEDVRATVLAAAEKRKTELTPVG